MQPQRVLKDILKCSHLTKELFVFHYAELQEKEVERFYLSVLKELEKTVSEGNYGTFKTLSSVVEYIGDLESSDALKDYYSNADNPIKNTNLVILACKHDQVEILEHILDSPNVLHNLSIKIQENAIAPDNEDEMCHTSFYYAIRSGNVEILETLINMWPDNYFAIHLAELDEILASTYEELKLKNVLLSHEIEIFVESKLLDLRFFSSSSEQSVYVSCDLNSIKERIQLVLENVSLLADEYYLNENKIDEKFLYILKFIALNINITKRQLRSTYNRLPWEEIEFCLIIFICSHIKQQEISLFAHAILKKDKIINHLKFFASHLAKKDIFEGVDVSKLTRLPRLMRDIVTTEIVNNNPEFEELYNDYQQIRDIYSLEKISNSINIALSVAPEENEYRLVITRSLQIIGEYLKNTLESPNLSSAKIELLLLSLQKNTRKIITKLRDSLSHAEKLSKRIEIEKNMDIDFFVGIQNDLKKICDVISHILFNNKTKMIRILLETIINSENSNEIKDVAAIFSHVEFDEMIKTCFETIEHKKLEKCIMELSNIVSEKTHYEQQLFDQINDTINSEKHKVQNVEKDYARGLSGLKSLSDVWNDFKIDHNVFKGAKFRANLILQYMSPKTKPHDLKQILDFLTKLFHSIKIRMQDKMNEINRLILDMSIVAEFTISNIKWIKEMGEKIDTKDSFTSSSNQNKTDTPIEEEYNNLLKEKLSELESILNKIPFSNKSIDFFTYYKGNKKLQYTVEMLVLDIMSILNDLKKLQDNHLFLDDNTPLLTGRCIRNHLAHYNDFIDLMLTDSSTAVILNAKKLIPENVIGNKNIFGKSVNYNLSKLKCRYDKGLNTIITQKSMFLALQEGNIDALRFCLKKGADISARHIDSCSTLHCACKGPSLKTVKFILDQKPGLNAKNANGQNPLHVAAACGRKDIVEFLVRDVDIFIGDIDCNGRTPLHLAAQNGYKDTVLTLLGNKADTVVGDKTGLPPLSFAIRNGHIDAAKVLLTTYENVDINEASGGYTPLHEAAESGYLELVEFLLQGGANVNAKNDKGWVPLHAASLHGHLDVVNALIFKGAEINAKVIEGCTPLHYAVENGHKMIVDVLLKHGANTNVSDKINNCPPLHYAAKVGYVDIVKSLLKKGASVNTSTVEDMTPLHFAAQCGNLEIVTTILKYNPDVNAKNLEHSTALHYAAENGYMAIVNLLIDNGALVNIKNIFGFTALHKAALKNHKNIAELLIYNNAKIKSSSITGITPLHIAARNGSRDVLDHLIKNNAEVNTTDITGHTPLHSAVINDHTDTVILLIEKNAEVNVPNFKNITPLHSAVFNGSKDIMNVLIENKAQVNAKSITGSTPLHIAVEAGFTESVKILIKNGADINSKDENNYTALICAVKMNNEDIVKVLVLNGADISIESSKPLQLAVFSGYANIVEMLLKKITCINSKFDKNVTLLHIAAERGHKDIVKALIRKGADVDAVDIKNETPLFLAAQEGHEGIIEILISYKASVNIKNIKGLTALHVAAASGHNNIVKVLLKHEANINVRDVENRSPIELAVGRGHSQVVKTLFQYNTSIDNKGNDFTLLHIASQKNNLDMIKYLINEGYDIHAENSYGIKPIHIAAENGFKDIVEYFLNEGSNIKDLGTANRTLLHYAVKSGKLEVVKYMIEQGAEVNVKDNHDATPMHVATFVGHKDVVLVLLENGAVYDALDDCYKKPLEVTTDTGIINLLKSTEKLFEAVRLNNSSEVENAIKKGAFVDAKSAANVTPLHFAAWKGEIAIVRILLRNKCNPNAVINKGWTPLHYAAKFSHLDVVKALLCSGAMYNTVSGSGKTPLDFTTDKSISELLKFVNDSFENVKSRKSILVENLHKIVDVDVVKAVMNTCNREKQTLVVVAMLNNFPCVEELKRILQNDVSHKIVIAKNLLSEDKYQDALRIFKIVYDKRKEILGSDNPGTLDIEIYIAKVLFKQGEYENALNILKVIFHKQKEMLGLNNNNTLKVRSLIAVVLDKLGKSNEALNIFQEVYLKQNETLGPNHTDTIYTQHQMALVLSSLGKYEEALIINKEVYKKVKKTDYSTALLSQNNIAMVLSDQGKYDEALKIYEEVLEKKKIVFGPRHSYTLRTLQHIALLLLRQKKLHTSLKAFEELLKIQKDVLGPNDPDTLHTQHNMANILFNQGKWIFALKIYKEVIYGSQAVWGSDHPFVLDILAKIKMINFKFQFEGRKESDIFKCLQKEIIIASDNGDVKTVQHLLNNGADVNEKDAEGRTPLHFAVNNGHVDIINILLKNGGDVTLVTNKGNTPLHTATSTGNEEVIKLLLQHVSHCKLNDFINAQTTIGRNASLHVAAKNGALDAVKTLLKHGAIYSIRNREGKMPVDLSTNRKVSSLLRLVEELFHDAKNGNIEIVQKLRKIKSSEILAITNVRNDQEHTLLQVLSNKDSNIANELLKMIKK